MRITNDDTILQMLKDGHTQKEIAAHFGVSPAAICKRVKKILPPPESLQDLTEKEQVFAVAMSKGMTQTDAAMTAFDVTTRASAKSLGSTLMAKPDIQMAVGDLMQQQGLTRTYRVRKLRQHVDNHDPNVSLKALDQSWKLEGAYTEKQVHVTATYAELVQNVKDIDAEIERLEKILNEAKGQNAKPKVTAPELDGYHKSTNTR
jgi:predicted transcriptional regulator